MLSFRSTSHCNLRLETAESFTDQIPYNWIVLHTLLSTLSFSLSTFQTRDSPNKCGHFSVGTRVSVSKVGKSQVLHFDDFDLSIVEKRDFKIENSPSLQLVENRLAREVQVLIGVYTSLKQQLENTKIEEVKDSDYIVVIDSPLLPIIHESPRKKRFVILVFSFAL